MQRERSWAQPLYQWHSREGASFLIGTRAQSQRASEPDNHISQLARARPALLCVSTECCLCLQICSQTTQ